MRFAYADPPYPGMSHLYKDHPDYGGEVDHEALLVSLMADYPDGWVLHTASTALKDVLPLCPPGARVLAWVKPFASFKPGNNPAYCWEPVILYGGRKRSRKEKTDRDFCSCNITLRKGLVGAKPTPVIRWLFRCLGAQPGDEMIDLYPGTGVVSRTWEQFVLARQVRLGVDP